MWFTDLVESAVGFPAVVGDRVLVVPDVPVLVALDVHVLGDRVLVVPDVPVLAVVGFPVPVALSVRALAALGVPVLGVLVAAVLDVPALSAGVRVRSGLDVRGLGARNQCLPFLQS